MKHHDKRLTLAAVIVAASFITVAYARPGFAHVDVDINIGVPPPPAVVFPGPPEGVVVPRTHVYYVPAAPHYDMYRGGPYLYINHDRYLYRSRRYRRPLAGGADDPLPR